MIDYIKGKVIEVLNDFIVIETGNFGIKIETPHKFEKKDTKIYTYLTFKDESFRLFGFKDRQTRELFIKLTSINGIGVKHAFSILKNFNYEDFTLAVENNRIDLLSSVPGIGKKTASRIILELKGKLSFSEEPIFNDAVEALVSLGFEKEKVIKIVKELSQKTNSLEELIKLSLQKLSEKG
ncbi:Holliday junction branch migration protein RuvA [Hydrogenivirga sp. 128-5-R1-1]|uniref:Holliday junction branch migration protein RuvA n=1 Tax=Hydrogenivirga sp. 128-5-R1-1 TaxID=392423 RepID=UPI00015F2BB6|nr:Holliday junction branch migration protein RuvA [Hydrogenivirga sp. 128-5-R1-1]EDP74316.1 Holliday junction resolvasome DNA-binding subunit [Hydrogenivirga sp. 128-5-R1-1]